MKNTRTAEPKVEVRDQRFNGRNSSSNIKTKMRRNMQRLGGRGLSLEAFANVKSGSTGYNPSLINKRREFYKNAKYVSKYKKSLKQDKQQQNPTPSDRVLEEGDYHGTKGDDDTQINQKRNENRKKNGGSLKELYENKREQEEKARMEREASFKAKEEQRQKTEARRKALRAKMLKKTKFGQPVMKYRIEHMLETLQGSTN